jgi:SPP1 gp7 family putative phage head morphogenesis protein
VTALPTHLHAEHDAVQQAISGVLAGNPDAAQAGIAAMNLARDRVVAVARTEIQTAANRAALDLYAGNKAVGGVMILETLDSSTCLICAPLHGTVYVYDAARRLPAEFRAPPFHPRCRGTTTPTLRSFRELYHPPAVARVEPPGARFSFERWLKRRPLAEQREILGPARLAEWKDGVPLGAFSDQGRVLTLGELRGREAAK